MKNRVKWDCVFPNPLELDRNKYYDYKEENNIVHVYGDKGIVFDYTIEQIEEFFALEIGKWNDILKQDISIKK